jgi:mannose-6-phosphate isomerase-like protein (cupin superfamily)
MKTTRALFAAVLTLAPAAFADSADHGLAITVQSLDTVAKSTQAAVTTVKAGDQAGLIPKPTVTRILALCEKVSAAQKDASSVTRGASALAPEQQAKILATLYPIVSALQDGATNGLAPITDAKTKVAVQTPLKSVQAALSTIQNTLAEGAGPTYISHDRGEMMKVADAVETKGWANCGPSLMNRCLPVATGPGLLVGYRFRSKPNEPEVHQEESEADYVVSGDAILVTGGTMVSPRNLGNGEVKGSDIKGGQSFHLTKGDVIVIPAGMPHWFKEVKEPINYFMVHQTIPKAGEKK